MLIHAAGAVAGIACVDRAAAAGQETAEGKPAFRIATFSADVTCPLGHPLIAGLRDPAKTIVDPLFARGFVLLGGGKPIVLCAVDWCEIRNQSYDLWRDELAKAAGTDRVRVLLTSIHQHDAPVTDLGATKLLADAGLPGVMFDPKFERCCVAKTAAAVKAALKSTQLVTHLGTGQAKVERIASNRRVVGPDGRVSYARGSNSGGDRFHRDAPDGLIDPWLKTLSFFNGDKPLLALHCYATHPMSYYGRGGVSADFVGMARATMQREFPGVFQIYTSGCSGDVTAGKYNNGSPENRPLLAKRLYAAMKSAWKTTKRVPLTAAEFRSTKLDLPFRPAATHTEAALAKVVSDRKAPARNRILAAMGLSSRKRVASGEKIDFPCVDFGAAQLVLFPGESFVGYQLQAQQQRPKTFVVSLGYGECWPGYIPTTQGFKDKFRDVWLWVGPGSDRELRRGLERVLSRR